MGALFGTFRCGDVAIVTEMGRQLSHRGLHLHGPVQIGDVVLGGRSDTAMPQPWTRGPLSLVGDIDLYNTDELQAELRQRGGPKEDQHPEQVILAAWQEWGPGTLSRLNGDFAFALHDARDGTVILARDRAGARPLYYARSHGGLAFASEYKALLFLHDFPREVDRRHMQYLHARKLLPPDGCLLKGVSQLPPASWTRVTTDAEVSPVRYWETSIDLEDRSFADHCKAVSESFLNAMERRIRNASPIGISLSGGVDSIAMVAAARKLRPEATICTFSTGDEEGDPELEWAARVAERYDTRHCSLVVGPECLRTDLPQLVWHLEDPIARSETLMTYRMALQVRGRVQVLLGGHGADGLFAGMPRHKILALADRLPVGRKTLGEIYSFTQTGVRPSGVVAKALASWYFGSRIPPAPRVLDAPAPDPIAPVVPAQRELLNEVLRLGPQQGLALLLQKVDRSHAAAGLRMASPFVDPDVIRTAFTIPSRCKHTVITNKYVWREAVRAFVPRDLAYRPKYAQRVRESPHFCAVLEEVAHDLLSPNQVKERGLFDPGEVTRLLTRPRGGTWPPEHAMRIWTLVLTELWAQIFIDSAGASPAAVANNEPSAVPQEVGARVP